MKKNCIHFVNNYIHTYVRTYVRLYIHMYVSYMSVFTRVAPWSVCTGNRIGSIVCGQYWHLGVALLSVVKFFELTNQIAIPPFKVAASKDIFPHKT